ncbi:winged helix DNA-binding domain-containing protein [Paenibacillus gansuensis]|uniref:Winged helix DNA-binding domain-containing protein n=1 Tax=Paenibacillus gansuensis TaxID=306542 RepID=A0ABW5PGJ0_9BACL
MPAPGQEHPKHMLDKRTLNRALLARQWLLERSPASAYEALEHLVGLQAQAPNPPYFALWTRLSEFSQQDLSELIGSRRAVRIALQRATLHLVSDRDWLRLRPVLQAVQDRAVNGAFGRRLEGLDLDAAAAAGRSLVKDRPLTLGQLGAKLAGLWSEREPAALANAVRAAVPLVQVPPRGIWGSSGQAAHTSAEAWIGRPLAAEREPDELLLRYLRAFGPATVQDMQVWSGLTRLKETVDRLEPQLVTFLSEDGRILYDLPDAPRPDSSTPAPVRFLSEFDSMLLSYEDRSRILDPAYKARLFTGNGIIRAAFLVNGFVQGKWSLELHREKAVLVLDPFIRISAQTKEELETEGLCLLAFAAPGADIREIQWKS